MATRTSIPHLRALALVGVVFATAAAAPSRAADSRFGLTALHPNVVDTAYVAPLGAAWAARNLYPLAQNWLTNGDFQVQLSQAAGLETVFALHSALLIGGDSASPPDTTVWKALLTDIVERYDGDGDGDMPGLLTPCRTWRLEEEWSFWLDSAGHYVTYLAVSRRAIRAADPGAEVVLIGLGSDAIWRGAYSSGFVLERPPWLGPPIGDIVSPFDTLLASLDYDAVDVHSYEQRSILSGKLAYVRSRMTDPSKPILSLEAGGPSLARADGYTDTLNARMVVRQTVEALAAGATRYVWALFQPGPSSRWNYEPWVNMPLTRGTEEPYTRKPAYEAYRQMTAFLAGYDSVADLTYRGAAQEDDMVFRVRFWRGGKPADVFWCTARDTTVTFASTAASLRVTRTVTRAGQTAETAEVTNRPVFGGLATLVVGADPLFVEELSWPTARRPAAGDGRHGLAVSARRDAGDAYAITVSCAGRAPVTLDVLGADGRLYERLADGAVVDGSATVSWGARGRDGRPVTSGCYLIRAASGPAQAVCRVVVLR